MKPDPAQLGRREGFAKLVIPSTHSVHANHGGEARRIRGLCAALLPWYDVEIVSLGEPGEPGRRIAFAPGFTESVVAKSEDHLRFEGESHLPLGSEAHDILAGEAVDRTPAFADTLEHALENADTVLGQPYLLPLARRMRPDLPFVYSAHNAEFSLKKQLLGSGAQAGTLLDRVRALEGAAVRDSLLIATSSDEDAMLLQRQYEVGPERFLTIPNGADLSSSCFVSTDRRAQRGRAWLDRFSPIQPDLHLRALAIFAGSLHAWNVQAAVRIVDSAPRLPHVLFLMVGSHGDPFRTITVPRNVVFTGTVPEAVKTSLMSAATVGLNPIESGSGTNLRLLEYFANGVPAVSTPLGTTGLRVADRVHLLVARSPQFVQSVQEVLANPGHAGERARAARKLVETEYDWSLLGSRLAEAIQSARPTTAAGAP